MKHSTAGTKRRARGFTLVELLVVIVIIVALAALSMGMLKMAMTKSRLTASINKVRDLGVRVQAYSVDHADLLPVYHFENDGNLYWWGVLVEDPKNESQLEIFKSPGDKNFKVEQIESTISYGWNAEVMGRTDTMTGPDGDGQKRRANFNEPSRILVLADGPKGGNRGLLSSAVLPDVKRYDGKAAGLLLDGSGRAFEIESEFKNNTKWFKDPNRQENP